MDTQVIVADDDWLFVNLAIRYFFWLCESSIVPINSIPKCLFTKGLANWDQIQVITATTICLPVPWTSAFFSHAYTNP